MAAASEAADLPAQTSADAGDILADFEHSGLTEAQKKFLMAQISTGQGHKPDSKFVLMQQDKIVTFEPESFSINAVLYFKACRNCVFTIESRCTKVFVEDCHNCTFHFNSPVLTGVFEVWKCTSSALHLNTKAHTIQADLNKAVHFIYDKRPNFHFLVWAGCEDMLVRFKEEAVQHQTGLSLLQEAFPDLIPDVDQFKVSFVSDKLITERIVRLPGGYPSTDREADAFDAQVAQNDKAYLEHVRKMVKDNPALIRNMKSGQGIKGAAPPTGKKIKPNDPCSCGSKKKYKVCCGNPKLKNPKKMTHESDLAPVVDSDVPIGASFASSSVESTSTEPTSSEPTSTEQ